MFLVTIYEIKTYLNLGILAILLFGVGLSILVIIKDVIAWQNAADPTAASLALKKAVKGGVLLAIIIVLLILYTTLLQDIILSV